MMSTTDNQYPVRVQARLDEPLSRWLWLVKWLFALPHYLVLALLWMAFAVYTAAAFVAILFTERYPRALFDFNIGVLRWTWRVQYYAYAGLGTDRYPPFTLADVADYPARLEVEYPQRLSRGLVLVKWWLLALPHYLVVALFAGGGIWFTASRDDDGFQWAAGGLIGILVLVAAVVLLVTGRYPRPIYDFVLGMDRWVVRVGAYAALMTDTYPPFRLDMGGADPTGSVSEQPVPEEHRPSHAATRDWTPGRTASVVVGAVLALTSMGLFTGGSALLWVDRVHRDADGFLAASRTFTTDGYAIASEKLTIGSASAAELPAIQAMLGEVRVRATEPDTDRAVFVGVAPSDAVARYLTGVPHVTIGDYVDDMPTVHSGTTPVQPPEQQRIWVAQASGAGTQTINWQAEPGDWTVVVLNADASPGVHATVEIGAEVPALTAVSGVLIGAGVLLLAVGSLLIAIPVYRASGPVPPGNREQPVGSGSRV